MPAFQPLRPLLPERTHTLKNELCYMLSHVYVLTDTLPDGQGHVSASPWGLTRARGASAVAIPYLGDPLNPSVRARTGRRPAVN